MLKLSAKSHDDLKWKIDSIPTWIEFDLGLQEPYFPIDDEMTFQALSAALHYFTQEVWPLCPHVQAVLYRGSANFSSFFRWTERQEENFLLWQKMRPAHRLEHAKRLFTFEAFFHYFQMLAHKLPDEMPLFLHLETKNCGTRSELLHLLSLERRVHFQIEHNLVFSSSVGICFPLEERCSFEVLEEIEFFLEEEPDAKPVYELFLTEGWDGLEEIYVLPHLLSPLGRRKLKGFEAAGGKVTEWKRGKIRGRGI